MTATGSDQQLDGHLITVGTRPAYVRTVSTVGSFPMPASSWLVWRHATLRTAELRHREELAATYVQLASLAATYVQLASLAASYVRMDS